MGPNILAIISIVLWCFSGICFRKGASLMGSMVYLTFMTGGGALTALIIQVVQKKKLRSLFLLPKKVMIAGLFGVALYTIILATAFEIALPSDVGVVNLINYLWPVWIVVLGMILIKQKTKIGLMVTGILCGFAGVVISNGFSLKTIASANYVPHLLACIGGLMWALYSVLLKKWHIPDEQNGTTFHFIMCALIAASIALIKGQWGIIADINGEMLFWIIFGALGPVGIAYYCWERGVKKGNIHLIASLSYFIPIGSSILIGLIFKETMGAGLIIGALCIALGSWLVKAAGK